MFQKGVPCVNEYKSRNICSSEEKIDIFKNLRHVLIFFYLLKGQCYRPKGVVQERVCFSTFSHIFLRTFPILRYFPMLNKYKLSFKLK